MSEPEFWKYWHERWPHASCREEVLGGSANYEETRKAFFAGLEASKQIINDDWVEILDELLEAAECAHDWFHGCKVDGIDDKHLSSVAATEKLYQAIMNTKEWKGKDENYRESIIVGWDELPSSLKKDYFIKMNIDPDYPSRICPKCGHGYYAFKDGWACRNDECNASGEYDELDYEM